MEKIAICFTACGKAVIEKLNTEAKKAGIAPVIPYVSGEGKDFPGFSLVTGGLHALVGEAFSQKRAIIFVGAMGICIRTIAPFVKDKLTDSPVLVIDDAGRFVIPVLSGHVGGGNKLAVMIAKLLDAEPVLTTSTDVNGVFSADVFAGEKRLSIANRDGIKKVSAKAIEGKPVTLSIKDYPPADPVDIIVADETDREYDLLLKPRMFTLGVGMKKGKDPADAEAFLLRILESHNLITDDIYAICTIDVKQDEPALRAFSQKYSVPLLTFDAPLLQKASGTFTASSFVERTVGVDNVCERAAMLGTGNRCELIMEKTTGDGITAAICKRRCGREE
ncbi:MAG: cobalamin biosynthesis protein [Lachnospiraceae bacterium]|nr:cobalamin biosynthesis protein [Lachnospiraceae bacterium]